jgi:dihydropteroate synthase
MIERAGEGNGTVLAGAPFGHGRPGRSLDCGGRRLDLGRPAVMGVLNTTPDSFSDGGLFDTPSKAVAHAVEMVAEGADLIDVGGESTRPGAPPVSADEELARVLPVIRLLAREIAVPISIDTYKPGVMKAAVGEGAGFINDIRALRAPGALETAAALDVPVCLMHMQGEPGTMQQAPHYDDVVSEVAAFLCQRRDACVEAGIGADRILIDPGFGFGKTVHHNLLLLADLDRIAGIGPPVLVGLSRKSTIGRLLGRPLEQRTTASVVLALLAVQRGASVVRVHDVGETRDALSLAALVDEPRALGEASNL